MEKPQTDSCSINSSSTNCNATQNVSTNPNYGRLCHIIKRPDFDGYGFNLHSEKIKPGQYIGKVDPNSPAEAAGLREGDQIIEVNGVNIGIETHKQVVHRIKAISNEVRLLLIDPNSESVINNAKSDTNIAEDTTASNKINNNSITKTNIKSDNTTPSAKPSSNTSIPAETTNLVSENILNDDDSSLSMVGTKLSTTLNNNPRVDVTDFDASKTTNGNHAMPNGKSSELLTSTSDASTIESTKSQPQNMVTTNNKTGLNLNLTAAEMRAKLQAKKKVDPKNHSVDLKKKFDIIQKL